jgi:hypothetical protein
VDRNAPRLGFRFDEQQRFLTEDEHGGAAEEMRGDDRRARGHGTGAVNDGNGMATDVGH